ncbi:ABC transporter permease [Streptomonospora sediminis]
MFTKTKGTRSGRPTPRFTSTLASEWAKLWSVSATYIFIAITAGLTVGITSLVILFGGAESMANAQAGQRYEIIFFGASLGVMAFSALGAAVVTVEYRTGMLTYTLISTPRRWRVLAAKFIIVTALALVIGTVISFANFIISQSLLGVTGENTLELSNEGLLRSVAVFIPMSMAIHVVLAMVAAVVLRNAAGAVVLVLAIDTVPVWVAGYLGDWFAETVPRRLPGSIAESLAGVNTAESASYLPPLEAALTAVVWLIAATWLAFAVFSKRDT